MRDRPLLDQPRALRIALFAGLILLALVPLAEHRFYTQYFTKIMIMAIFAMSLDLLVGYVGLVSLGHALFFGVAGYTLAMLTPAAEPASLWFTLPAALGIAAAAALVIGFLVLRTSGVYFIMVTLAFGQMAFFFVHDAKGFGGSDGKYINFKPLVTILGQEVVDLDKPVQRYYAVLACLVLVYFVLRMLMRSLFGQVLIGCKINEHRMSSLGYPTFRYKLAAFVIAGTIAGLAGYLQGVQDGVVNPELLSWHQSGHALVMVILGGMGTPAGPALGAAVLMLLELSFSTWTKYWQLLLGGFIIAVVFLLPNGLASLFTSEGLARLRRLGRRGGEGG